MSELDAIRERDASAGALWFTGPVSFTAQAARDRRALLVGLDALRVRLAEAERILADAFVDHDESPPCRACEAEKAAKALLEHSTDPLVRNPREWRNPDDLMRIKGLQAQLATQADEVRSFRAAATKRIDAADAQLAAVTRDLDEYREWHVNGRANVDYSGDVVRICKGHHDKHEPCEWTEYVPNRAAASARPAPSMIVTCDCGNRPFCEKCGGDGSYVARPVPTVLPSREG